MLVKQLSVPAGFASLTCCCVVQIVLRIAWYARNAVVASVAIFGFIYRLYPCALPYTMRQLSIIPVICYLSLVALLVRLSNVVDGLIFCAGYLCLPSFLNILSFYFYSPTNLAVQWMQLNQTVPHVGKWRPHLKMHASNFGVSHLKNWGPNYLFWTKHAIDNPGTAFETIKGALHRC